MSKYLDEESAAAIMQDYPKYFVSHKDEDGDSYTVEGFATHEAARRYAANFVLNERTPCYLHAPDGVKQFDLPVNPRSA